MPVATSRTTNLIWTGAIGTGARTESNRKRKGGNSMRSISAVIGLLAIASFAGAANAGHTIDLLWGGVSNATSVSSSSSVTLNVVLTNTGPMLSQGGGVTVDYSGAGSSLSVVSFQNFVGGPLLLQLGSVTDTGTQIRNINAGAFIPFVGTGLGSGATYLLGTVTFHAESGAGTFPITALITATDGFINADGSLENPAACAGDFSIPCATSTIVVPEPETIATTLAAVAALIGVGRVRRRDRTRA